MSERPLKSRADLDRLKTLGREEVLALLGSFDDRDLSTDAFVLRAAGLLDPGRVPGLDAAMANADTTGVLSAVQAACTPTTPATPGGELAPAALAIAEDALANRFTFYGETHALPATIDWDFNPGTAHWGHDLNRFSYLPPLVQAHAATDDARFARKAVELILSWITACDMGRCFAGTPYMFGSYLNNAIHASGWARCARVLLTRDQLPPTDLLRILKSLHEQLAYLEIVTNGHKGNWPTIGCMGILGALAALPVLDETDRLAQYAARTMGEQIEDQVLPDGVQDELTPHYHRCVVNNLLDAQQSLLALGLSLERDVLEKLRGMVHYTQHMTVPDASRQVAFNDSDPDVTADLRPRLARLGLEDFLLDDQELVPTRFPYAGVALLRQPRTEGDLYLAFDAGPFGRSHQHEDKLGFWLFAYGRSFIVDPGRHLYDWSDVSYYSYLRSTTAHSTLKIDGQEQHSRGRPDTWIAREPAELGWRQTDDDVRAAGVYDLGYGEDNAIDARHYREIVLVRNRFWVVFDRVEGEGEHEVETRFQFAPGELVLDNDRARTCFDDANLLVWPMATTPFTDRHVECGQERPRGGWYSGSYGNIESAPALSVSLHASLPIRQATLLFPYPGAIQPDVAFSFDGERATLRTHELGSVEVSGSF